MEQYPDIIVLTVTHQGTQNPITGAWSQGATATYTFSCRLTSNNYGRQVKGADGVLRDYAYMCYMPKTTTVIPQNSTFSATALNNGNITGTVKHSHNGLLNSRLWL
jgi:hypothetical protein